MSKVRQLAQHLRARVPADERAEIAGWLTPAQLAVFDGMHVADRRHGLNVVRTLRRDGVRDEEVLLAGLLHDAGKGATGVGPRVAYSLGQALGPQVWEIAVHVPGWRPALCRLRDHAELSARLAAGAGCSERTVELIRYQEAPRDPVDGQRLLRADEAN